MAVLTILTILFSLACIALWFSLKNAKRNPPLPPGPPAEPLIGHFRLIPQNNQEMAFYKWGKIYGDVIHIHFLGRSIIVLNSVQAATDLLDKRSANYSDRPAFPLLSFMGWSEELSLVLIRRGTQFPKHRRLLQNYLGKKEVVSYRSIQTQQTGILLRNLLSDDEERDSHIQRFSATIIISIAYGHQVTSADDPYLKVADRAFNVQRNAGEFGRTPVDFFPFLRHFPSWFPGAFYAGYARDNRSAIDDLHEYPITQVKRSMAEGKANPSFLTHHLDLLNQEGPDNVYTAEDIRGAAGIMYWAGADTTWSSLSIFFLAMTLHPECQVQAQEEIDAVIGSERLPTFEDRSSLPYVESLLQESLRWNSAAPLGVPHSSMEDDVYNGMFIPKDSIIIANTRAMTLDERVYSDPFKFNPSRFLPAPEGRGEPYPNGPFGFGRRICPGRHLADASLWIAVASILATITISKALDENGKEITPEVGFTDGITSHPHPYQCRIRARNERAKALVAQTSIWDS